MAERDVRVMLDDLTFHVEEVEHATDDDHRRRSVASALAVTYRLQDALSKRLGNDYWQLLDDGTDAGKITGAVNLARNVNTHTLFVESAQSELLVSETLIPSDTLTIGKTLRWADYSAVQDALEPPRGKHPDRRPYYLVHLSQRAVVPSMQTVIEFYEAVLTGD
jgi:hypothetical protein